MEGKGFSEEVPHDAVKGEVKAEEHLQEMKR